MKKWMIIILFSVSMYPQSVEITSLAHSIVSGYTINYQMLDRQLARSGGDYAEPQKKWRASLHLEYATAVGIGLSIALENSDKQWYCYAYDGVLAFTIREAVRPIFYNLFGNRAWDKQPNTDMTYFPTWEKFWNTYTRLLVPVVLIIIKYIWMEN